ncbi:Hypothetical predicted protein, partial [Marmota monax]
CARANQLQQKQSLRLLPKPDETKVNPTQKSYKRSQLLTAVNVAFSFVLI